jgi:4-hydroxybenzoate polyprenyltransferase
MSAIRRPPAGAAGLAAAARPAPLPDAPPHNWVDRRAPAAWRPWLKLGRFDRPAGIWLLLLPGWQGVALAGAMQGQAPDWSLFVRFAVGAAAMRAAGCAYNDIVDRHIDAKVARTALRPIPSGQISVKGAWRFVVACALTGLAVLLTLNLWAIGLGVLSLGLVAAYPFMKRITWWPQAWLGLTFNWGALLGFAAAGVGASGLTIVYGEWMVLTRHWLTFVFAPGRGLAAPALLLYASGVFWTLGYDTIYAVQDLEDDALAGVKSSARRLGSAAPRGVMIFYLISALLALGAGFLAHLGLLFYPVLAVFALHLLWQSQDLKVDDAQGALRLFRSNRDAGAILVVALALGAIAFKHV